MNRTPSATRRAFSLIELVVVVLILGILAGVAAPKYYSAVSAARLDSAARRVAADLRYTRSEAQRTSLPMTVYFSVDTNAYEASRVDDPDHPGQPYGIDLDDEPYGVEIDAVDFGGGQSVTFGPHGVPDASGYVRLSSGGRRLAITCDAAGATQYASW